ncbi:MAG: Holliday junction branch migration protein RuvA [Candidatus Polarisedimenticolia bacterium]
MIARLTGCLIEKEPHQLIVEAGGVGYRVCTPLSTFIVLPPEGSQVTLRVHTHVREDAIALYGFGTRIEQDLFERLIEISGIGPRLGLAILSGLPAEELMSAISDGDAARLRAIPGVGPKTADRMVLELRDRVRNLRPTSREARHPDDGHSDVRRDVVSALVNLGYQVQQAEEAVRRAATGQSAGPADASQGSGADQLQQLLKRSLQFIGGARMGEAGSRSGR